MPPAYSPQPTARSPQPPLGGTGLKPGCNCRRGLPRWPTFQYSERGGRSAVARRRKKNESDEGPGHLHLKMTALAGRLKPTQEQPDRNNSEGGRVAPLPLPGHVGLRHGWSPDDKRDGTRGRQARPTSRPPDEDGG